MLEMKHKENNLRSSEFHLVRWLMRRVVMVKLRKKTDKACLVTNNNRKPFFDRPVQVINT